MPELIGQGGTITLDAFYSDATNAAVDPTTPQVTIKNPAGETVVSLATPTRVGVGHFQYAYDVDADASLGAWEAEWYGLVNGVQVGPVDDGFTVVTAGSISTQARLGQTFEPWATHDDVLGDDCAGIDSDEVDEACVIATDILWNLTGRRWSGVGTDTVRPQAQWRKFDGPKMWWPQALSDGYALWGYCSCHRGRETGCASVPEIRLPSRPIVAGSVSVKIDGAAFADFRLDDGDRLVRTDGDGWPCCQDLLLGDDQPNTFSITWRYGRQPPVAGKRMAALYGCQLALAFNPDTTGRCRIKNAVQVTRQGSSTGRVDPTTLAPNGLTGLPEVDAWVGAVRLGDRRRRATIMVPGRSRSSRRVGR
jgi:hypothetical protein